MLDVYHRQMDIFIVEGVCLAPCGEPEAGPQRCPYPLYMCNMLPEQEEFILSKVK